MIRRYLKKYGWLYIPGVIFLAASSYIQSMAPLALGRAIDYLSVRPIAQSSVYHQIGMILLIAVGTFVTRFIWRYFIIGNARNMECWLREELFDHLQRKPAAFFSRQKSGDLMAYAINDVNAVRMTFGPAISQLLTGVGIGLFSVLSMAGQVRADLTAVALLPVVPALFVVYFAGRRVQKKFRRVQEKFAEISGTVNENIAGMRVIKSFVQEEEHIQNFTVQSDDLRQANISLVRTSSSIEPVITVLFGVSFLITLLYGGDLVQRGEITLGGFVAFTGYLAMIVSPVLSIARVVNLFQRGLASWKRLNAVIGSPDIPDREYKELTTPLKGGIEARGLTFQYPDGQAPALEDVSFTLLPGQVLGVVGATGAGKTTLVQLLMKFFDTEPGMLFVDGADIRSVPARGLRERMAYVPQDGFLFNATVEENIAFYTGKPHVEIVRTAKIAGLAKDLSSFPNGYETNVGERGGHLSGGQKQRVAIARALARDPSILILDDSLSAVDNETERLILTNLRQYFPGRTVIVVSHRLSAVEKADKILCMERGRVAEQGTHAELLARGGLYADLWNRQVDKEIGRED